MFFVKIFSSRALSVLVFTNFMIFVSGAMLAPIYAFYVERIGGDLLDASVTGGIFALTTGIVTLFAGKWSDRLRKAELLVALGYLIIAVGYFGYILVNSVWMLFVVQVVIGIGRAIYWPVWDSLYSKHLPVKNEGSAWGVYESSEHISIAVGAFLGGIIVTWFGFEILFLLMGFLSLFSAFYVFKLPRSVL